FSDGVHSPDELVEVARAEGLDFIAVTDHNTISAFAEFGEQREVLVIPGMEVTLLDGHFNVLGVGGWSDWMEGFVHERDIGERPGRSSSDFLRQTSSLGLLNSLNHPVLKPWEWSDGAADMGDVHFVEVWNDPSWADNVEANPEAIALWTKWLEAGHRITAIGGSDYHRPTPRPGQDKTPERLGLPSTYVYAEQLSGAAIMQGLRRHRAYISMGAQVSLQAQTNGKTYEIGDDLGELSGAIDFKAAATDCPSSGRAQIVRNGHVVAEAPVEGGQTVLRWRNNANPAHSDWYRLDLLGEERQMLAITNPIYAGTQRTPAMQKFGDFVSLG
ncbi:MAG: CehA/McbA family metallohydrolase, partial [Anaerolineales bacterium]